MKCPKISLSRSRSRSLSLLHCISSFHWYGVQIIELFSIFRDIFWKFEWNVLSFPDAPCHSSGPTPMLAVVRRVQNNYMYIYLRTVLKYRSQSIKADISWLWSFWSDAVTPYNRLTIWLSTSLVQRLSGWAWEPWRSLAALNMWPCPWMA